MSMDYNTPRRDKPITEQEGVVFAATPVWDRGRKRRGLGPKKVARTAPEAVVAPEPRSFAAAREAFPQTRPLNSPEPAMAPRRTVGETLAAEEAGLVAPIGRPSTRIDRQPESHGVGPAAIAAGAVALVAIGTAGWFVTRDNGVPEITPGSTTSEVAAAPLPPVELPPSPPAAGERASNILPERAAPAAAPPSRMARAETRAPARTRPAAAASAESSGTNASATLPEAPQPYTALNPDAAPAPVNPAPAVTAPAPEPITSPSPVIAPAPTDAPPVDTTAPPV